MAPIVKANAPSPQSLRAALRKGRAFGARRSTGGFSRNRHRLVIEECYANANVDFVRSYFPNELVWPPERSRCCTRKM
jgi:hypothetical protein